MKKTIKQRFFLSLCLLMLFSLFGGGNLAWAQKTETITLADGTYKSGTIVWAGNCCTITQEQGSGSDKVNKSYVSLPRWYTSHVITFAAKEGYTLTGVTIVVTDAKYVNPLSESTYSSGASASASGTTVTITTSGDFTVTMSAQSRISSITVSYVANNEPALETNPDGPLSFGNVETSSSKQLIFTLSGQNLTADATLSIDGTDKGYFSVAPASVSPTEGTIAGTDVTVTYTPTAVGSHTATLTIASSGATTKEIALSGTCLPTYNVSWMVNGVSYTTGNPSTSVKEGESVTALPTEPAAIGTKKFVGWTNEQIAADQSTAPTLLFTTPEDAPAVTGNVTYHAVFATEAMGSSAWKRIKTLADITDGSYVIKNADYILPNANSSKAPTVVAAPAISGETITGEVDASMIWSFTTTGTANQFYVKNADGSYLYENNDNNGIRVGKTSSDKWTFAVNTADYFSMKGAKNNRYCATYNNQDWRSYTSATSTNYANGGKLELYKLTIEKSYTDYVTTISSSAATVTFDAGTNGTCATESLTETSAGAGVTLPACVANDGYQFVGWSTSETPTSADAGQAGDTYYPGVDCTLYAYYKQLYTVTIEEPANGTIEVKHGENVVNSGDKFLAGDVLTITATPAAGYKFRNLQVEDGSTHTYTASNVKEWTMNEANITISAKFDEITYSTITKVVNGVSTPELVENGTAIPFVDPAAASIPTGYVFMGWTETPVVGTQPDAPTLVSSPVTASTDATYYAVFAFAKETTVVFDPNTVESNPELTWEQNGITLKLSAGQLYTGTTKTFTVTKGSTNNFTVTSTVGNLKKLTATISDTNYKINSSKLTSGAKLTTNGTTQTITFTQDLTKVVCPATSNYQIRLTKLEVQAVASPTDYCTTIPDVELAVGATGYATLYYSNFDLVVPENTEAYTFGSVDGELMESKRYDEGTVIPAGEAVVVYTINTVPCTLNFKKGIATAACDASSQLAGTDEETAITPDADYYFYGLSLNSSNDLNSVGFYWMAADGAAFTNGEHKAYLKILKSEFTGAMAVKGFAFKGTTTGVESVESNNHAPQVIYDLAGRRVSKAEKGLYIINGKKVIK